MCGYLAADEDTPFLVTYAGGRQSSATARAMKFPSTWQQAYIEDRSVCITIHVPLQHREYPA